MTGSEAKVRKLQGEKREFPKMEARPLRPLAWLGKRLLILALASGAAGYAFHLFGTWPLGVIAVTTPIGGWVALILGMQRTFRGPFEPRALGRDDSPAALAIKRAEADLATQLDWKRRFGT